MEDQIINAVDKNKNLLLTGGAGVGKTFLTNKIIDHAYRKSKKIAVTAMTGLASQHLSFGQTIHRFSMSGGYTSMRDFGAITSSRYFQKLNRTMADTEIIIIDEISMMRPDYIHLLDALFKHVEEQYYPERGRFKLPFGGRQIIAVGDFLQLPPIIQREENLLYEFAFQTEAWRNLNFSVALLTEVKRQNDLPFINTLNKIRIGHVDDEVADMMNSREDAKQDAKPIMLMSKRDKVSKFNTESLNEFDGRSIILEGIIKVADHLEGRESVIKQRYKEVLAEAQLEKLIHVKTGCRVMCLHNDTTMDISNGMLGTLIGTKDIDKHSQEYIDERGNSYFLDYKYFGECLEVEFDDGRRRLIPRKEFAIKNREGYINEKTGEPLNDIQYWQYPIALGYAISIHKSQGMSLDNVHVDCAGMFAEGQLYVGVSRARSLNGLSVSNFRRGYVMANQTAVDYYFKLMGV